MWEQSVVSASLDQGINNIIRKYIVILNLNIWLNASLINETIHRFVVVVTGRFIFLISKVASLARR